MTAAVLLAHGSPDPRAQTAVHDAAAQLAARVGHVVTAAFLDHDERDLARAVTGIDADADDLVVLPLLLSTAYHARVDVPAAVAALDRDVTLLDPVGHPALVLDVLLGRCERPAVIVAAGTRVDDERRAFAVAVAEAAARTRVPAVAAFATGPGRRVQDAARPGSADVVPWLLSPGRLLDSVEQASQAHGCRTVGTWLLHEESLLGLLAARLTAGAGVAVS